MQAGHLRGNLRSGRVTPPALWPGGTPGTLRGADETMAKSQQKYMRREDEIFAVRVLAEAEGWSMVRRPGAVPFCAWTKDLHDTMKAAAEDDGEDQK